MEEVIDLSNIYEEAFEVAPLGEIAMEVHRQGELWDDFDKLNTANDWVAHITRAIAEGAYDGRYQSFTQAGFRRSLIKAAALCVSAVNQIDKGQLAPRHYDTFEEDNN